MNSQLKRAVRPDFEPIVPLQAKSIKVITGQDKGQKVSVAAKRANAADNATNARYSTDWPATRQRR